MGIGINISLSINISIKHPPPHNRRKNKKEKAKSINIKYSIYRQSVLTLFVPQNVTAAIIARRPQQSAADVLCRAQKKDLIAVRHRKGA